MSLKNPLKYSKTRLHTDPELLCFPFSSSSHGNEQHQNAHQNNSSLWNEWNFSFSSCLFLHILLLFLFIAIQWFNLPHLVYIYSTSSLTCLMRLNIFFILQSTFFLLIFMFISYCEWRRWKSNKHNFCVEYYYCCCVFEDQHKGEKKVI